MICLSLEKTTLPRAGNQTRRRAWPITVTRMLSLALGGFTLINLAAAAIEPAFQANLWWVDLRALPGSVARFMLAAFGLFACGYAIRPIMSPWRRRLTAGLFGLMALAASCNASVFFALLGRGRIDSGCPLPLSLPIALLLGWIGWRTWRGRNETEPRLQRGLAILCLAGCAVGFPAAQMVAFGLTDYRRPADAAVVFGCLAYPDGRCSAPLSERVRTACALYHEGTVDRLIFSGGPTRGQINETDAMRNLALQLDVPDSAILCDRDGLSTATTVSNTAALCKRLGYRRVLTVSHFYHLPRIKLAYQRAGCQVYTVPARQVWQRRRWLPYAMAREVAAWWWYYKQALIG